MILPASIGWALERRGRGRDVLLGVGLGLLSLVAACGEPERHVVVHMGAPMAVTEGASVGYEANWGDGFGDEPADFPRGTPYVDAVSTAILVDGQRIHWAVGPVRLSLGTERGLIYYVHLIPRIEVPIAEAAALVQRIHDESLARGFRESAAHPYVVPGDEAWTRCAHIVTEEEQRRDAWGAANRRPSVHLIHPEGVHLWVEFRCSRAADGVSWRVSPTLEFKTRASCCGVGEPLLERTDSLP